MRAVVLDTNVLLSQPDAVFGYPGALVIVPEAVLGEIDKLKTSRVDPDLRFRGREVSRILFTLSETGSLVDGVPMEGGGELRVAALKNGVALPDGLSSRNADDRILAVACQARDSGLDHLTLVTNDLNMLLKAQTHGLRVEHRAEGDPGLGKRTARWFSRYRTPLTILAIAIAVFAGVLALSFYTSHLTGTGGADAVPTEFRDMLTTDYRNLLDGLITLERDPANAEATKQVADAYYDLWAQNGTAAYAYKAISYYESYLRATPSDNEARTDLAAMYFYAGDTDKAIQAAAEVIADDPQHIEANYNLGLFYWHGRSDYASAATQFMTIMDLTRTGGPLADADVYSTAQTQLGQLNTEATAAGVDLGIDAGYLPEGSN